MDLTASKGGSVSNGSNATGTSSNGSKVVDNSNTNSTQVLVLSLEVWQGAIPAPVTKPSRNGVLNGSNKVIVNKDNNISSNGVLNVSPNELVQENKDTNVSGTKNGPVDLTAHENKSVSNGVLN